MIKIISFNDRPEQIGGAQIPAYAFKAWMDIFGIESEIVTTPDEAVGADWYFLATPGPFNGGAWELDAPFALMAHAEFDSQLYKDFGWYLGHPNCKLFVTITDFWGWINKPKLHWHPCTHPDYLLTEGTIFNKDFKEGIIYAARISRWKSPNLLAALTKYGPFMEAVDNQVHIIGKPSSDFEIDEGNYIRIDTRYDSRKVSDTKKMFSVYKYFWDYASHPEISNRYKRLNLAAYEAISEGCIPVVNPKYTDPSAIKFGIDLTKGFPNTRREYILRQDYMKEVMINKGLSYNGVKDQVVKIVEFMS